MPNHFTPLGNHAHINTLKNDTITISLNINESATRFKKLHFLRRLSETHLQHLRRMVHCTPNSKLERELIQRVALFLAIRQCVLK